MISKFSIRNFKSCRDVQIDLERFTVFVGPNASGKSSILQGLDFLCRAFRPEFEFKNNQKLQNESLLQNISRESDGEVDLICEFEGCWYRYRASTASKQISPQRRPPNEPWSGQGRGVSLDPNSDDWNQWKKSGANANPLPFSVLLRLETSKLVNSIRLPDTTVMGPDGSGLHFASANMALNEPDSWQTLQADLRQIIPSIRRLRHSKAIQNQPSALLFDTVGAESLSADQVSEGTLLVLGLLLAVHSSGDRKIVLLDDLDRGLHPRAQTELISFLRKLLETKPDLQLLATTHSPYMLDSMEANEVRMTYLREDGTTVCGALVEHPEFEKWKDEMTPGEMWSLFGERWIAESSKGKAELVSRDVE